MLINKYISELILKHNCVIIPGVGGFIANTFNSYIDNTTGVIYPPSKKLLFNASLKNNDGLLISSIAVNSDISYAEAARIVDNEVAKISIMLKKKQVVEFNNVGKLYFDSENNIQFEVEKDINFLTASFGLSPIQIKKIETNNELINYNTKNKSIFIDSLKWAAILLPLLTLTIYGLINVNYNIIENQQYASLFLIKAINSECIVNNNSDQLNLSLNKLQIIEDEFIIPKWINEAYNVINTANELEQTNNYMIIIGAFSIKENAEKLVNTLVEDYHNATTITRKSKKLILVSIDCYESIEKANEHLAIVKQNYPEAWVYKNETKN